MTSMIGPETMTIVDNGNRETMRSWVFVITRDWQKARLNKRELRIKIEEMKQKRKRRTNREVKLRRDI